MPHRGKPNSPYLAAFTLRAMAAVKGMDVAELCDQVTATGGARVRPMVSAGPRWRPVVTAPERLLGPAEIRQLADRLELRPTKKLGQNFVIDPSTVRRIAALAGLRPEDVVLEVGPGFGSLTLALLAAARAGIAVEIDPVWPRSCPPRWPRRRRGWPGGWRW